MVTKQLKKKHSSRLIGGTETGSQGGDDGQQGGRWHTKCVRQWLVHGGSEAAVDRPGSTTDKHGEQWENETDTTIQASSTGN